MDTTISPSTLERLQQAATRAGQSVDEYLRELLERDTSGKSDVKSSVGNIPEEQRRLIVQQALANIQASFAEAGLDEAEEVATLIASRADFNKEWYRTIFGSDSTPAGHTLEYL